MYAQLLPDILSSRIPKMADGKQYPVAGARALGEGCPALMQLDAGGAFADTASLQ